MMKYNILFLLLFVVLSGMASKNDEKIFEAMTDELNRNMNELQYEQFSKPFYIRYSLSKKTTTVVYATLGGVLRSNRNNTNGYSVNVKIGDYNLTDEKFVDKTNRVNHRDGSLVLPKELDYLSIRRTFWLATNNSYKNASEVYKNKTELIEEQGLDLETLKLVDFSKEKPSKHTEPALAVEKTEKELADYIAAGSALLKAYPRLIDSYVSLEHQNTADYVVNSEGTKQLTPFRFYVVKVSATQLTIDNKPTTQSMEYYARTFDDLPDLEQMESDIKALTTNIENSLTAAKVQGKVNGPIVLEEEAIVNLLVPELFAKGSGLIASPKSLTNEKDKGLYLPTWSSWATSIGRKVIDRNLSVVLTPHLEEYDGRPLLGTIGYDDRGVLAPDSVVLIDKGMLQQQLIGRIPTTAQKQSLGHTTKYISGVDYHSSVGPSVVHINAATASSDEEFTNAMKELIEEEGYEYVYRVRPLACSANKKPINYYRVDVASGEEQLLKDIQYKPNNESLKSIEAVGNETHLSNVVLPNKKSIHNKTKQWGGAPESIKKILYWQLGAQGTPTSVIYPSEIMLKSVSLEGVSSRMKGKKRLVSNPMSMK